MATITFAVPGTRQTPRGTSAGGRRESVKVSGARAGIQYETLTAEVGQDVVVLRLANGAELTLHPETARELLLAQKQPDRARDLPGTHAVVSAQLAWDDAGTPAAARGDARTRGALLDVVEVVKDAWGTFLHDLPKDQLLGAAADLSAEGVVAWVDGHVREGLYRLRSDVLPPLGQHGDRYIAEPQAEARPYLVLVHGTFVDTQSTFGKLWDQHSGLVQRLFADHAAVLALDHHTLGKSPVENALLLAQGLPRGAKLRFLTHSRGGLVAEAFAQICARVEARRTLSDAELSPFSERDRTALRALFGTIQASDLHVERLVRVACPARGTLLASKRLDAYLSAIKWGLDLAHVPVLPQLLGFLTLVASRRLDPDKIPGLAAMVPDAPLLDWMSAERCVGKGDLRVLAGDSEGDDVLSWFKTLMADAFFWTDNDLVVQTRSMYGGFPREEGRALFYRAKGASVSHFTYFAERNTATVAVDGLLLDAPREYSKIGPASRRGLTSDGARGRRFPERRPDRPALILVPGILGSHLAVDGDRIWLDWELLGGFDHLAFKPGDRIRPDGLVGSSYDALTEFFEDSHDVIEFPFDWRAPLEEQARAMARVVSAALDARPARGGQPGPPVRFVAHSMGGLLVRTMMLVEPDVWARCLEHPESRCLMLGTPNGGSWTPMQVLTGDDKLGNLLALAGKPFRENEARQIMAEMPGFLQLQAGLSDPSLALHESKTWAEYAARDAELLAKHSSIWHRLPWQKRVYDWGIPPQSVLNAARHLRQRLDDQRAHQLPAFADRLLLVLGESEFTPDGFEQDTKQGFTYRNAVGGGDGRVTRASACLPGVKTWQASASHGDLSSEGHLFGAYLELLERGKTTALSPVASRGEAGPSNVAHVLSRPSRERSGDFLPPPSLASIIDGVPAAERQPSISLQLEVSVVHGNLKFIGQPLMLGHYRSWVLTGAEKTIDDLTGNVMSGALRLRHYPSEPGDCAVFVNTHRPDPFALPRPERVIVVGLGDEGSLTGSELARSVRAGVLECSARKLCSNEQGATTFELAATLIGSGGAGMTAGEAARAIATGTAEANQALQTLGWPLVGRLVLVEVYLDRAAAAWDSLGTLQSAEPNRYRIGPQIVSGRGGLGGTLSSVYRGTNYDIISTRYTGSHPLETRASSGELEDDDSASSASITYTVDTRRARTEAHDQTFQANLVWELIGKAPADSRTTSDVRRALTHLLVPQGMDALLGESGQMVIEVDERTAAIPWELFEIGRHGASQEPWALSSRLIRKFRTTTFRNRPVDALAEDYVLVIGEPDTSKLEPAKKQRTLGAPKSPPPTEASSASDYPPLPAAAEEAREVAALLRGRDGPGADRVIHLEHAPGAEIIVALLKRDFRIVHVSGHGEPGQNKGVVLSGGAFLGINEIRAMRVVPDVVFVNCCHLGVQAAVSKDRPQFAASIAEELIRIGVKCVVAAGWAVEDGAARAFALGFYKQLVMEGGTFAEAVTAGRREAYRLSPKGSTWGAYQCYGDSDFRLQNVADARPLDRVDEWEPRIPSARHLRLYLDELTTTLEFEHTRIQQLGRLRRLVELYGDTFGHDGSVAEGFALAFSEAGDWTQAKAWFERALRAEDGATSLRAWEQYVNQWVRHTSRPDESGDESWEKWSGAARDLIQAIDRIEMLANFDPTAERLSLLGSARKRLSNVLERMEALEQPGAEWPLVRGERLGSHAARVAALEAYQAAEQLVLAAHQGASAGAGPDLHYPSKNCLELQVALGVPYAELEDRLQRVEQALADKAQRSPDFWVAVGKVEADLLRKTLAGTLSAPGTLEQILEDFRFVHDRVPSAKDWSSVRDQAEFVYGRFIANPEPPALSAALQRVLALLRKYATP